MQSKWSLRNAALWGAGIGALVGVWNLYSAGQGVSLDPGSMGELAGSVVGGVLLFVLATYARNAVAR